MKSSPRSQLSWLKAGLLAAAIAGTLALAGCGADQHETAKSASLNQWNMTRVGIIYQLAEQQYKVGDYDKCNDTLKDAFAIKAQFSPVYVLAAKVQIEQGNLETAADYLNTAMRINAGDPEPYYLLGVVYQRWQKADVACDYYKQAWARKTDEARYMLAAVEMEISLNHLDEAQKTLESRLVYFEQSAAVRIALARIATLKNDFLTAAKCYREAADLMPDDKNVQRAYAESLFYAGRFADAVPLLEDLRNDPAAADRGNLLMMLGQSYLGLRRSQDARNCFQQIIRDNPENMLAYLNLGKACIQTGDLGISLAAARKVLRNDPDNLQAMILIALTQQKQNKWADAESTLARAGVVAPQDTTVLCMRGVNAQQLGKHAQAVAFYQKAVAVNPGDAWANELLNRARPVSQAPAAAPAIDVVAPDAPAAMARIEVAADPKAP